MQRPFAARRAADVAYSGSNRPVRLNLPVAQVSNNEGSATANPEIVVPAPARTQCRVPITTFAPWEALTCNVSKPELTLKRGVDVFKQAELTSICVVFISQHSHKMEDKIAQALGENDYWASPTTQVFAFIGLLWLSIKIFSFWRLIASLFVLPGISVRLPSLPLIHRCAYATIIRPR